MRIAVALVEAMNGAWWPIYMKKAYIIEDFNALKEKFQKIEDFIVANNKSETSPFAQGTENPTQLDAHIYVHIERINMIKGTSLNDIIWENIGFNNYPSIVKLIEGVRSRPEFQGEVIANQKPWGEFMDKAAVQPAGVRL